LPPLPLLPPLPPLPPAIKVNINVEIESLDDMLKLIEDYPMKLDVEYNINMQAIHNIKEPLLELKNMIGMTKLKNSVVDQLLYFIQEFHKTPGSSDFLHSCIYGPPGTGKTEVAKIMGKIFSNIGVLKKNTFKKVTRSDLIAGYLGQTAIKTRDVIKEALGGVLFIDEAYALGNSEKRDSFAKECIDTLCEALSDHKSELMVIIAGYEQELKDCFFSYNRGLTSRFTWRFKTDDYKAPELNLIFQKKIKDIGWSLKDVIKDSWFEKNMGYFKYYGRDMETLLAKVKIAHARRVFCKPAKEKKILIHRDIDKGFELYLCNEEVSKRNNKSTLVSDMYI
jgi:SpoVK/Ycf46/Vps4 family AAA+-type ATPase